MEGEFAGTTECNDHGGNHKAEADGDFEITNIASTDELCSDTDHSAEFLNGLTEAEHYELESGRLTLHYGKGGRLVFLVCLK